ncbi:hypothetical protein QR685DRAFT_576145 [Neurospora intermedia]|uniref:Uncharacterized protein n=1 Tax=Neurospora intermedia TaxID=5142 RepID=A0ABR3CYY3_NEUIN
MESSPIPVTVENSVVSIQEPTSVVSSRPDPRTMQLDVPIDGAVPKNRQMLNGSDTMIATRQYQHVIIHALSCHFEAAHDSDKRTSHALQTRACHKASRAAIITFSQIATIFVPD